MHVPTALRRWHAGETPPAYALFAAIALSRFSRPRRPPSAPNASVLWRRASALRIACAHRAISEMGDYDA